jgi:hypothetical protein
MDEVTKVIAKLVTQYEEILLGVNEIRETLNKQRDQELVKRLEKLEISMKDQHIKLDALNAIDINPTIVAPTAPATVRVARGKNKRDDNIADAEVKDDASDTPNSKQFVNITDYFKHLWVTSRELLYEKGVITEDEYKKIYEEHKEKFNKKKNDLILQRSIAFQIWKTLPQANKDIVHSMKNQNNNDVRKKKSTEISEEKL